MKTLIGVAPKLKVFRLFKLRLEHFLFLFFVIALIFFLIPVSRSSLYPEFSSFKIYDRSGNLLREVLSRDYKTSQWADMKEMSPHIIEATILEEDKRFYFHHGVDPIALLRAGYENLKYRKIVSGGSTITMQVAKMVLNLRQRSVFAKLAEIAYALKLEVHLSKKEILEIYLNRIPYGNQTYGVEAASHYYFAKPARQLSLGECCILAIIPKSPSKLNPSISSKLVLQAKKRLLNTLLTNRQVDSLDYFCAINESLAVKPRDINFKAPHFVDFVLNEIDRLGLSPAPDITTSLDLDLQQDLEKLLATTIKSLQIHNVHQGALIVMETKDGEIRAMVGSKNYFDEDEGQVNGCLAMRQPGSSIKPFVYILALESGIPASVVLPDTVLEFELADGTKFAPRNYGDKYHGPTRAREALASSFNVPTVYLLEHIGVQQFYNLLKELNFEGLDKETNFYGLSLGLGAAEATLLEMVNAYRAICRGGIHEEHKTILYDHPQKTSKIVKRVFSRDIAYIVTDILSDNASRLKAFGEDNPLDLPFPCAAKTGTSKDFRDNWCIGFTKKYIVGVWVGNFDGSPMEGVSGISGAAPLFRDIMIELHRSEYPTGFEKPTSLTNCKICARSGLIIGKDCPDVIEEIFLPGTEPQKTCGLCRANNKMTYRRISFGPNSRGKEFKILKPSEGDVYKIDPQVTAGAQSIIFKVRADTLIKEVMFRLNGQILGKKKYPFEYQWQPEPGEYTLEVTGYGVMIHETDSVSFKIY